MKTFVLTVLFVAASLMLAPSGVLSSSITINSPVMLDTSAVYQESGGLGGLARTWYQHVCAGDSVILYTLSTNLFAPSTVYFRTNRLGAVLDSVPHALLNVTTYPYTFEFQVTTIQWMPPYFCVVGAYAPVLGQPKQVGYIRVTSDGSLVDSIPRAFDGTSPIGTGPRRGSSWWDVTQSDQNQFRKLHVFLADMATDTKRLTQLVAPFPSWRGYGSIGTDSGLYVAAAGMDSLSIETRFIRPDGSVTILDSVLLSSKVPWGIMFSGVHYGADSALFYSIDSSWQGALKLRYYIVSSRHVTGTTSLHEISLPYNNVHEFARLLRCAMQGDTLNVVDYDQYSGTANLVRVDVEAGSLLSAVIIRNSGPTDPCPEDPIISDGIASLTMGQGGSVRSFRFQLGSPAASMDSSSIFLCADQYNYPNLLRDNSGLLLYWQHISGSFNRFEGVRIGDGMHLSLNGRQSFFDGQNAYRPIVRYVGNHKVLFWNHLTDYHQYAGDLVFEQDVRMFDGDFPIENDAWKTHVTDSVSHLYGFRHNAVLVDSMLYFDNLLSEYYDGWSPQNKVVARALNINQDSLASLHYQINTNGQTAMLPGQSGVKWIASTFGCSQSNHVGCLQHWGAYDVRLIDHSTVVYSNQMPLVHGGMAEDVSAIPKDSGYWLTCQADRQLVNYDSSNGSMDRVADLYGSTVLYSQTFYPVPISGGTAVFDYGSYPNPLELRVMVFDDSWSLIASASIPTRGFVSEFSDFVRLPEENTIAFAYSSHVVDKYASNRLFYQTVTIDIATDVKDKGGTPNQFTLAQNYPNPFNGETRISFSLPARSDVSLDIFNILGQQVWTRNLNGASAGQHQIVWDGKSMSGREAASGVYFYRLTAGSMVATRKMLLLK